MQEVKHVQALSWHAEDYDFGDDEVQYVIKLFGMDISGTSVGITIKNFTPFFFVKIDDEWTNKDIQHACEYLLSIFKNNVTIKLIKKKEFWGFTNNEEFSFIRLAFQSHQKMKYAVTVLSKHKIIPKVGPYKFKLYESNVDPLLRFFHIANIEPTGWLSVHAFSKCEDILPSRCPLDIETKWTNIKRYKCDSTAPFIFASFDIECISTTGDFPVPKQNYTQLITQLYSIYDEMVAKCTSDYNIKNGLYKLILYALDIETENNTGYIIRKVAQRTHEENETSTLETINALIDDIYTILQAKGQTRRKTQIIQNLNKFFTTHKRVFPKLSGDPIIQIGTTFHKYGSKDIFARHIITLDSCSEIENATVESCDTEAELLLKWTELIQKYNPDIITGYNINGFDFEYMYHRASELQIETAFMKLSRFNNKVCKFKEQRLSSSALGDNILKFIDMEGRVLIDCMKVIQRDHKLDSYKLDNVAKHFIGMKKNDVSPQDICALQKGSSDDRKTIAEYCLQDCALCNYLIMKLEIFANNMGMSNVCIVPMSYIFMRGQGIKIFSLVLNECRKEGFLIPTIKKTIAIHKDDLKTFVNNDNVKMTKLEDEIKNIINNCKNDIRLDEIKQSAIYAGIINEAFINLTGKPVEFEAIKKKYSYVTPVEIERVHKIAIDNAEYSSVTEDDDGYEGAIVLDPKEGIYIDDPISVLDYASLYPSSMISENLSHDCIVLNPKYDNLPNVEYLDIFYDIFDKDKVKIGEKKCRYVQGHIGVIPNILMKLLNARKETRKKITWKQYKEHIGIYNKENQTLNAVIQVEDPNELSDAFNEFQKAVLDGLQNAYKVTANSLYGQIGAKTSQIYLKDIAACTTATGRKMIMMAKEFLEKEYNANIIYGDTDSIFVMFPGSQTGGKDKILPSIKKGIEASAKFKKMIKHPHDLEYEKTFWPFILLSKKRYVGNVYEHDDQHFKQKSMGIVLKRRDNANIVKRIYGGIIDIILNERSTHKSIDFLKTMLNDLISGKIPIEDLIISKSLKAEYKDPTRIAHKVLAERIAERDPGNKPMIGDRIPYVYVEQPEPTKKMLQGERIETPDYMMKNDLKPDYDFYITNQIMKPILQLYALIIDELPGFTKPDNYYNIIERHMMTDLKDASKVKDKLNTVKEVDVKALLFDDILIKLNCKIKKSLIAKKYYKSTNVSIS